MEKQWNNGYDESVFGLQEKGKNQFSFIIPYCKRGKDIILQDGSKIQNSLVLMLFRSDGKIGFPGGWVEKEEKILDAAVREFKEELCNDEVFIKNNILPNIQNFKTFTNKQANIHSFIVELQEDQLYQLPQYLFQSEHYKDEIQGSFVAKLFNHKKKGIESILKHNFAGSAKNELLALIEYLKQ